MEYKVEVHKDHLEKLANARPIQAIAELIWNGLDADSSRVEVIVNANEFGFQSIIVRDDGLGINYAEAPSLFGLLGGSWKADTLYSKKKSRILHGKEGKGRFKGLALGRVAEWVTSYEEEGKIFQYSIILILDSLIKITVTDPVEINFGKTGTEVHVSEIDKDFRSLENEGPLQELSETFALYLSDYSDVTISYQGRNLDPSAIILNKISFSLDDIIDENGPYPVELQIIEWKVPTDRIVYFCSKSGFPFARRQPKFHTPGYQFSAYIKSEFVEELVKNGGLDLLEMNPILMDTYEAVQNKIKEYYREKEMEYAKSEIEQWKAENLYPFDNEPKTVIEEAERKVFDIVALNVNRHLPDFSTSNNKNKAFQLRMLRQAIESGPEDLQNILIEVLDLPDRKIKELAKLLEEATLSNIISASKLISNRLKFIKGIEVLLFDPDYKKQLKERSQLHRLLADNTWVFGEEFNLTGDDEALTTVLRKHSKLLGSEIAIDRPVTRIDGKKGVIDLMLSRSVPRNHSDERKHLVIELKRPTVVIGSKEITQIKDYAFAVKKDERFRSINTRWSFWIISNDIDEFAKNEANQKGRPRGMAFETAEGDIEVWIKTWSELIEECTFRLNFINKKLQTKVDKKNSLKYLRKTYAKYLKGITEVDDISEKTG